MGSIRFTAQPAAAATRKDMWATPKTAFSNLSAWTIATWVCNLYADGVYGGVFQKGRYGTSTTTIAMLLTATPTVNITLDRSTQDVVYVWNTAELFDGGWHFYVVTFDRSGTANALVNLYHGDEPTSPTLITPSSTQDGSGTYGDDSADYGRIGNDGAPLGSTSSALMWPMGLFAVYNRVLSLDESVAVWQNPFAIQDGSCQGLYLPTNPSFCRDLSGKGNDTIVAQSNLSVLQYHPTLMPRQLMPRLKRRTVRKPIVTATWPGYQARLGWF